MTDSIRQEKKEEEDSLALKIAWMPQYEDSKFTLKRTKDELLIANNITDNIRTNITTITRKHTRWLVGWLGFMPYQPM